METLSQILQVFQSTLLQEERRVSALNTEYKPLISIHAPTRGATCTDHEIKEDITISIHAPTRGATK